MSRSHRQVDISVSFRIHDASGLCAYVMCVTQHRSGQLAVDASTHVTAHDPITLADQCEALVRSLVLEHFLPYVEPF